MHIQCVIIKKHKTGFSDKSQIFANRKFKQKLLCEKPHFCGHFGIINIIVKNADFGLKTPFEVFKILQTHKYKGFFGKNGRFFIEKKSNCKLAKNAMGYPSWL